MGEPNTSCSAERTVAEGAAERGGGGESSGRQPQGARAMYDGAGSNDAATNRGNFAESQQKRNFCEYEY